jgi:hypothetical protein
MADWQFHDVSELDKWLPGNQWVQAMIALLAWDFAFDKQDKSFRLRKRRMGERKQYIVPLLSGVTLPQYLGMDETEKFSDEPDDGAPFEASGEGGDESGIPDDERLVLDRDGAFVLSSPDLVTETIGILARRGAGKTYLANVIAEEFLASSFAIPFVVLDPTGVWRGLGANEDGTPNGNRLVVFGGEHGHYALQSDQGQLIARIVVGTRPLPAILDLSLLPLEAQHGFVADFISELYLLNKEPLHLFLDEADVFAPQKLDKSSQHHKRSLNAVDNIIRRGRTRGIGATLITQRAAVINKNVLTQVGGMFFLQMGAPNDLDAAELWMGDQVKTEARRECRRNLPILGQGQAYYLHGGERYTFSRFTVRTKRTFDSSITPRLGTAKRNMSIAPLTKDDRLKIDAFFNDVVTSDVAEQGRTPFDDGPEELDMPVLGEREDSGDSSELTASWSLEDGDDDHGTQEE